MRQMQFESFRRIQAANYRHGQDWIAAFAGRTNFRDPETGKVYSLPSGYGSYCLDATSTHAIIGRDVKPGTWAGAPSEACARMLQPN